MEAYLIIVAPVTILVGSFWVLSRSFHSYSLQLFHTMPVYSRSGCINEK